MAQMAILRHREDTGLAQTVLRVMPPDGRGKIGRVDGGGSDERQAHSGIDIDAGLAVADGE